MAEGTVSRIPVKFTVEGLGVAEGEFIRYLAPRTVDSIVRAMPLEGRAATWGMEVYFQIPVRCGEEKSKTSVEKGTVAYWPMGSALCIFYGDMKPYSAVNPVGRITENLKLFEKVKNGTKILVERLE
ncbi:MAG: hypothetical protein AYL31_001500 [Candidatus Bathyarchaeota archaeon B26-1]|nr:MAG: hypothetical protein AYL31_001500 [Candidatus Bathyarchaeota archaeon B26-1]